MSTINGFGTTLRDWNHQADETAFATSWLVFSYLPVLPLRRYHVRVLTDFANERFVPAAAESAWLGGISWREPIERLARLPLSWREIGLTYLRAYVLVPLLCVWPLLVTTPVLGLSTRGGKPPTSLVNALVVLMAANVVVVLLCAVRRTRGYRGIEPARRSGADPPP